MKLLIPNQSVVFQSDYGLHTVDASHPKFDEIVDLVFNEEDYNTAADLIDVKKAVEKAVGDSGMSLVDEVLMLDGEEVPGVLAERILTLIDMDRTVEPLILFIRNLRLNTSKASVEELYGFLEASQLPITDDGHFLAYKMVSLDYKDMYTHTIPNSVGSEVAMERRKVDDNRNRTCSTGLHFAAYEYASSFGNGKLMVLKVNPKDVVSIPKDYNNQKGRCCAYTVYDELEIQSQDDLTGAGFVTVTNDVFTLVTDDDWGWDEDDDRYGDKDDFLGEGF